MPRSRLHHPPPVELLMSRVQALPAARRELVWHAYRRIRRLVIQRRLPGQVHLVGAELLPQAQSPEDYTTTMLALKLARAYSMQELTQRGPAYRPYRAVVDEALKLVRLDIREGLGLKPPRVQPSWALHNRAASAAWVAVADGSYKRHHSAIGLQVFDESCCLRAEVGMPVNAHSAVAAELMASVTALQTLLALGARAAVLLVDAESVLCALRGSLPLKYSVLEAQLARTAQSFDSLQAHLVPRTATYEADRLAAAWSSH